MEMLPYDSAPGDLCNLYTKQTSRFACLLVPERPTDRALWQTTCLLIPLNGPPHGQAPSQLEMVEQLLRSGCHLVAGRMSTLDGEQRKRIAEALAASARGREKVRRLWGIITNNERNQLLIFPDLFCLLKMVQLHMAPCLIMALQGEEIVAGFSLILKRYGK